MPEKNPSISSITCRNDKINLIDFPWGKPFEDWMDQVHLISELPQGVSRHPVSFIKQSEEIVVIKEMPAGAAQKEYKLLERMVELRLPVVNPIGNIQLYPPETERSYLVTQYLDRSIPYRSLFMTQTKSETRTHLLDAMASLLVQLHLVGIYWGDCSLSNTLFRRDAGALSAYLVDAESAEYHENSISPTLRFHELQGMEENILLEMLDIDVHGIRLSSESIYELGNSIRQRYHALWDEITRSEIISRDENYRVQERVNSLNQLGFSIQDIHLSPTIGGNQLVLKIVVGDRNFHRDRLLELTGLETEELQARKLINEIHELRATLSQEKREDVPIEAAAYHWLMNIYKPILKELQSLINDRQQAQGKDNTDRGNDNEIKHEPNSLESTLTDPTELYCEVLEHKWYLSEQAKHDVGHLQAVEDFVQYMSPIKPDQDITF